MGTAIDAAKNAYIIERVTTENMSTSPRSELVGEKRLLHPVAVQCPPLRMDRTAMAVRGTVMNNAAAHALATAHFGAIRRSMSILCMTTDDRRVVTANNAMITKVCAVARTVAPEMSPRTTARR